MNALRSSVTRPRDRWSDGATNKSRINMVPHHLLGRLPVRPEQRKEQERVRRPICHGRDRGAAYIVISPGAIQQPGVVPAADTR